MIGSDIVDKSGNIIFCGGRSMTKVESTHLWHERFDHINYEMLGKLINRELVQDVPKINAKIKGVLPEIFEKLLYIVVWG